MKKLFKSIVLINYIHVAYHLMLFGLIFTSCEAEHVHRDITVINKRKVILSRCQFPIERIELYSHLDEITSYVNCDYDENGRVLKEDSFSSLYQDYIVTRFFNYSDNAVVITTHDPLTGVPDNEYLVQTETVTLF